MDIAKMTDLVEKTAKLRDEPPIPRQYIEKALQQINADPNLEIEKYPSGAPTLKAVYEMASKLMDSSLPFSDREQQARLNKFAECASGLCGHGHAGDPPDDFGGSDY